MDLRKIDKTALGAAQEILFTLKDNPTKPIILFGEIAAGKGSVIQAVDKATEVTVKRLYTIQCVSDNNIDDLLYLLTDEAIGCAWRNILPIFTTTNWRIAEKASELFTLVAMKKGYQATTKELNKLHEEKLC